MTNIVCKYSLGLCSVLLVMRDLKVLRVLYIVETLWPSVVDALESRYGQLYGTFAAAIFRGLEEEH